MSEANRSRERPTKRLAGRAGFRVTTFRRSSKWVSLGFVAQLVANKYPRGGTVVRPVLSRLARLAVPYRAGDLVTAILEPSEAAPARSP